jgi:lysozyme
MNLARLKEQLEIDEGVVHEIYLDHLGYPTFGVGHLITKKDPEYGMPVGTKLSEGRIQKVFHEDVLDAIADCHILYGKGEFMSLPSEVQEILANMMFNLGLPRLAKFVNMKKAVMEKDWPKAAEEMKDSLWYKQVKTRSERLYNRMKDVK